MENYEDILNRDNTCLMDINSQAIAAMHNIDYKRKPRNPVTTDEKVLEKSFDKKRKISSSSSNNPASKRSRTAQAPSPPSPSIFPLFEDSIKEQDNSFWDINSQELAAMHNIEYVRPVRPNLRKSKSTTSNIDSNLGTKQIETSKATPLPRSKTFPKVKSQNGLYRTIDIASPRSSKDVRKSNSASKISISDILNADNTFLLDIDCEKIAAMHNIDLTVPPENQETRKSNETKPSDDDIFADIDDFDDLTNLTQCLIANEEANEVIMTQVKQCIKHYNKNDAVDVVENHDTMAVFVRRKDEVKSRITGFPNDFCGLSKQQKKFFLQTKGIEDLYDWQYECLALPTVRDKQNLLYALPTSGGKSLVAEVLILREIIVHKKNAIMILPFVSIVQEKLQDLVPFALQFGFLVEEYCAGKGSIPPTKRREKNSLYIATAEKCQILIDSLIEENRIKEIGLVVIDELHMIGDKQRGHNLELLISKLMFLTATGSASIEIIGMSATIENLNEIAKFINADLYCRDFRPIELKEYIKMGDNLFYIDKKAKTVAETFKLERANVGGDFSSQQRQLDPDHISALVMETLALKSSCLIFCASKKSCENVALLLTEVLDKKTRQQNREEKKNLIETIKSDSGGKICEILLKTIPYAVSYHHSGLTAEERRRIEDAFRSGIINVICCTSTLAAGVNLPAGRVIIRSPKIGRDFITLSTYKQMIGRAGRAGKSLIGDSILICNRNEHQQVVSLLTSKMDYTVSNFITEPSFFRRMILNLLSTKLVKTYNEIEEFMKFTLVNVQRDNYDRNVFGCIESVIQTLHSDGIIEHNFKSSGQCEPFLVFDNEEGKQVKIYPDDELIIGKMGQATVNSGKSLEEAQNIEEDLRKANDSLVLTQPLHLLYIVAPKDMYTSINLNYRTFSEKFFEMERFDKSIIQTAKVIGISMAQVAKMMTSTVSYNELQTNNIKRFYFAMILFNLWNGEDAYDVARQFKIDRGIVSKLMSSASAEAYSIFKFCEVFDEFWVFKEILENFSKRLQHCCSVELLPLMELPGVKIGRAKMLYAAGIKSVMDVAGCCPDELARSIKFINIQQATKVIKAAKYLLKNEFDDNREKLLVMKDVLNKKTY